MQELKILHTHTYTYTKTNTYTYKYIYTFWVSGPKKSKVVTSGLYIYAYFIEWVSGPKKSSSVTKVAMPQNFVSMVPVDPAGS